MTGSGWREWWRSAVGGGLVDTMAVVGVAAVVSAAWGGPWQWGPWGPGALLGVWMLAVAVRGPQVRRLARLDRHLARLHAAGGCVFCKILLGQGPATIVREWHDAVALVPLGECTTPPARHLLVIPRRHARSALEDPHGAGVAMRRAAQLGRRMRVGSCNFITSCGACATQTVEHTHVHLVERVPGDGLALPWAARKDL